MYTKLLLITILLVSTTVKANYEVVLMLTSLHSRDNEVLDNNNVGLGIEYTNDASVTFGSYVYNNSYSKTSLMLNVTKSYQVTGDFSYSLGLAVANNYSDDPMNVGGLIAGPELGLKYGPWRVKTTAGLATLVGGTDVINLQYVWSM